MGLLRTVETIVTLAFALPAIVLGVESLLAGNQMGWVFLTLAAIAFGVNHFVDTPSDWVEGTAGRVIRTIAKDPED